jgi:hypothetical protein
MTQMQCFLGIAGVLREHNPLNIQLGQDNPVWPRKMKPVGLAMHLQDPNLARKNGALLFKIFLQELCRII